MLHKLVRLFRGGGAEEEVSSAQTEAVRARFRERCGRFRRLLSANKAALEAMAEVEQHLHGTQAFGMRQVRAAVTRAGSSVFQMIQNVNALSDNRYGGLVDSFMRIEEKIEKIMQGETVRADGPAVMELKDTGLAHVAQVGGKMANLGEILNHVDLPVPDGFAITADAYHRFMRHNRLQEEIDSRIQGTDVECLDDVFTLSSAIQQKIRSAPMPDDVAGEIEGAMAALLQRTPEEKRANLRLALRSSAVGEDALGASFAGQYHSELNVHPDEILDVWRDVVASKYAVTAMTYRYQRGIPDQRVPMCVGVLVMINARAGGVAYSRDPVRPHVQCINAVHGLPRAVVDGSFSPDTLVLSRQRPVRVLEAQAAHKPFRFYCDPDGGVRRVPLEDEQARAMSIDENMACRLGGLALALEEYYGQAQDVEWAVDEEGEVVILQSRPLKEVGEMPVQPAVHEDNTLLLPPALCTGGESVSPGIGAGMAMILRKDADILSFIKGGVLVVERADPRWATLLSQATAIVAEAGGTAGHLASVAREYGIPAVFGLSGAVAAVEKLLREGETHVTVDAVRGAVYAGMHPDIPGALPRKNLMLGSPIYTLLHDISRLMVPLNLLNPASADFTPENCRTLHDITRFCHEKSVSFMFGQEEGLHAAHGKQLKAGVKLKYWIIDLDDGFRKPVTGPVVDITNICSAPMLALWHGMTAVHWAGPPATDASGFLTVVMESAMNPELEATAVNTLANHNFLMISSSFMNLQARFGYHFCTVETQASAQTHENYVSFQFKGGAASVDRRILRARMVGELLEEFGFRVDVKEDALFATAEGYTAQESLARTVLLGYLLLHTRQVDMIMHNAPQVAALREKLLADMQRLFQAGYTT